MFCHFPNLYNRGNNTVLEISGNMVISGDINVNDSGQIFSNLVVGEQYESDTHRDNWHVCYLQLINNVELKVYKDQFDEIQNFERSLPLNAV